MCGGGGWVGTVGRTQVGVVRLQCHSHLQNHDNVGLFFEGIHTLDQLGVVEAVHDADLLTDAVLLLGGIGLEKFPRPDFSSFLFHKSEDLSKLPTGSEREEESQVELSSLRSRGGRFGLTLFYSRGLLEHSHTFSLRYCP